MDNVIVVLQHEMQRKLGRCMLRLQQYEHLLKTMIVGMGFAGRVEQLTTIRDKQAADLRNKTLGALVNMFVGDYLASASADIQAGSGALAGRQGKLTDAWASVHFAIDMSPDSHAQTKADLAELVGLRNELVHHFIERFDIADENGCRAAIGYLADCYERIDGHCRRLHGWVVGLREFQAKVASLVQSEAFEAALFDQINHDDVVCRPDSPIVLRLRSAEAACHVDGWTPLSAAIVFIGKTHREEVPSKYGCRTWKQVLKRSGQFEVRYVAASGSVVGNTWYRSRQQQ